MKPNPQRWRVRARLSYLDAAPPSMVMRGVRFEVRLKVEGEQGQIVAQRIDIWGKASP